MRPANLSPLRVQRSLFDVERDAKTDASPKKYGNPPHTYVLDGGTVICPASDGNSESGAVYDIYLSGGYIQGLNEDVLLAAANHILY